MNKRKIAQLILIAVLFLLGVTPVLEASLGGCIHVAWDPNTEPDLAGYKIHYGTASGAYTTIIDVGNVTDHTIPLLTDGQTYFIAATAYDSVGNSSGYSNEVSNTPGRPGSFRAWRQAINGLWREIKGVVFSS